jgi:hypothetical protein
MLKSFVLDLHGEWSEVADECICLLTTVQRRAHVRLGDYSSTWNVDLCRDSLALLGFSTTYKLVANA